MLNNKLNLSIFLNLLLIALALLPKESITYLGSDWLSGYGLQTHHIIISLLFLSMAHLVNAAFKYYLLIRQNDKKIPALLQNLISITIYALAIASICSFVLDFSMAGFWASTGVIGIVLGVALKNIILDLVMGLSFSVESEFKIGDFIILHDRASQSRDNIIGQVIETNWRSTHLIMDGKQINIPNSVIGTKIVTNLTRPNPSSEFEIVLTIDFSVETEHVLRVLMAGVKSVVSVPGILEQPEPKVRIKGINDLGVEYKVKYTIMPSQIGPSKARHFVLKSILEHLYVAGISLAYPKQDAYHIKMPRRQLDLNLLADRISILKRISLFKTLQSEALNQLASLMTLKYFNESDILIQQYDEGDTMYVLVEGLLYVYIDSGEKIVKVGQLTPGMFFGEMSLLTGEKRAATIKALTNIVVYEINRDHVNSILMEHPRIAESLSLAVAEYRLKSAATSDISDNKERSNQIQNVAAQIFEKMKSFFKWRIQL